MSIRTEYDRETNKGELYNDGYIVYEHDFNSGKSDDYDSEMTNDELQECFELVEQAKIDDEWFVSRED